MFLFNLGIFRFQVKNIRGKKTSILQQKTQQVLSQLMASPSVRALESFFHVTRVDGHDTDTGTLARVTYRTERFKVDKVRKRKLPFHENTVCFYFKQQTD